MSGINIKYVNYGKRIEDTTKMNENIFVENKKLYKKEPGEIS